MFIIEPQTGRKKKAKSLAFNTQLTVFSYIVIFPTPVFMTLNGDNTI